MNTTQTPRLPGANVPLSQTPKFRSVRVRRPGFFFGRIGTWVGT